MKEAHAGKGREGADERRESHKRQIMALKQGGNDDVHGAIPKNIASTHRKC
jgi:hypothetical protein